MNFPGKIHWLRLGVLIALLSAIAEHASLAQSAGAAQFDTGAEQQLIDLINQVRTDHGLPQLTADQRLTQAARQHTVLMVQHRSLSHQLDGESDLPLRLGDENLRSDKQGENIAYDLNADLAHTSLMQSPPHRANILSSDYNVVGVGVVRTGDHIYVTEDFARSTPDYSQNEADAAMQKGLENFARAHGMPVPIRKPLPHLRQIACDMALSDKLDPAAAGRLPGVTGAAAWNTADLTVLPRSVQQLLSQPLPSGYSLGLCYAASVSHPAGVYWLVMVIY